jgi:hypothetical protein
MALLEVQAADVGEQLHELGWTDGLPVVEPTPERVEAMVDGAGRDRTELLGGVAERGIAVNVEQAASNAVLAGCRPEYFPVVLAGVEAMLDPRYNAHSALTSTGGSALCAIVSGPIAAEIGMNARHNVLGPGNRANMTIGRALRLVARNVLNARTGRLDGSSIGSPAKISLCFAEDPPRPPWQPLHSALGFAATDTTVTLLATEGPRQVANHLRGDAASVLRTFAEAIRSPAGFIAGKGGQVVVLLGPEHALALIEGGVSRRQAQEFLVAHTRIAPAELEAAGIGIELGSQHDMVPESDGLLATLASPDDVFIVTAGGEGAGWSAVMPVWAPAKHSRAVTRRVRPYDEALPDCGPDACEVNLSPIEGAL